MLTPEAAVPTTGTCGQREGAGMAATTARVSARAGTSGATPLRGTWAVVFPHWIRHSCEGTAQYFRVCVGAEVNSPAYPGPAVTDSMHDIPQRSCQQRRDSRSPDGRGPSCPSRPAAAAAASSSAILPKVICCQPRRRADA